MFKFKWTTEKRIKLESLIKAGKSLTEIEKDLNCSDSTLRRELHKFEKRSDYDAGLAENLPTHIDNERDRIKKVRKKRNEDILKEVIRHQNRIFAKLEQIEKTIKEKLCQS